MSGDHAKKEMMTGQKSARKAPSGESANKVKGSPSHNKSGRSGDKKKKMRKVVYYETDSSLPSTSGSDAPSVTSKRHERKKFSKIPLCYPRISKRTPLLSVPLGKPPMFDGEDYNMWSDKMRHHLTSLHTSIWDVVVWYPVCKEEKLKVILFVCFFSYSGVALWGFRICGKHSPV
jgi:hypothetical protein